MRTRNGFTLIELLVVITIMVILAGLLIPGVLRAMRQAKSNRALSEMQHLATVLTQVYSEVGYYVRLEDLTKADTSAYVWNPNKTTSDYADGVSDDELGGGIYGTELNNLPTVSFWNGPYTTYKSYATVAGGSRPIDPWGNPTADNTNKLLRQYRMFWITNSGSAALWVPAGATGAMVVISAGGDGKYQCGITAGKTPADAVQADFDNFNPGVDKGDDVYYIFNAGIQ